MNRTNKIDKILPKLDIFKEISLYPDLVKILLKHNYHNLPSADVSFTDL